MIVGSPDDPGRSAALFLGAAEVIATWPDVWRRLIDEHVAGPHGNCLGCPVGLHGGTRWPCGLRTIGDLSQRRAAHPRRRSP
jgi:hypothetical protein